MEPNDLKTSPDDDAFDARLRSSTSLPPLADGGFSGRVLASLPPTRRRRPTLRPWFVAAGLAAGLGLALLGAGLAIGGTTTVNALNAWLIEAVNHLLDPAVTGALLLTVASVWFAFRDRWRPGWIKRV